LIVRTGTENKVTPVELYDLAADPSEKYDRLEQHADVAERLLVAAQEFHTELIAVRRPVGRVEQ
jgi:hypothetical protein